MLHFLQNCKPAELIFNVLFWSLGLDMVQTNVYGSVKHFQNCVVTRCLSAKLITNKTNAIKHENSWEVWKLHFQYFNPNSPCNKVCTEMHPSFMICTHFDRFFTTIKRLIMGGKHSKWILDQINRIWICCASVEMGFSTPSLF